MMEINKLKGIAERKLDHMRHGCFRGSLNHFIETGTINGSFLEAINDMVTECIGETSEENKPLQLPLKKPWFDLTKLGIKTEDYREITPYWAKRLLLYQERPLSKYLNSFDIQDICHTLNECYDSEDVAYEMDNWYLSFKKFGSNTMTNGYPTSTNSERIIIFEHKGIEIRTGNVEWGAEPNKLYFVIFKCR